MPKRAAFFLVAVSAFVLFGEVPPRGSGQAPSPRAEAAELISALKADSYQAAARLADKLLADPALDAGTMAFCGLAVLLGGRVDEAEAILDKAIARSPDDPQAHLGLGRIARIRNDMDGAVSHLRRAVPSAELYGPALRLLWRAAWDLGPVDDLFGIYKLAEERYARESRPLPSWFSNGLGQIKGLAGKRLFEMTGRFERLTVPLETTTPQARIRMIDLKLNGKGEYPFHIDSASADFLTLSPLQAADLGLALTGSSTAVGVGTAEPVVRFAVLDKVEIGPVTFRNVPVMVSDIRPLRGLREGLIGTALLKRFNVTIDVETGTMDLFPLDRPDLLAARVDRKAVATDVPLYLFDATTVGAAVAGAPPALYILDSAAATNLVDAPFFAEHIKPGIDPARIVPRGIRGAGGEQTVNMVDGIRISLGPLAFDGQTICEFPMDTLNMMGGRYLAGLVGNPLLWPYRVHMDFKNGRLILEERPLEKARPR